MCSCRGLSDSEYTVFIVPVNLSEMIEKVNCET